MILLLNILPLVIFRISYIFFDLFYSIAFALIAGVISFFWQCYLMRKFSAFALVSPLVTAMFCGLYLVDNNSYLLKISATIVAAVYSLCFWAATVGFSPKIAKLFHNTLIQLEYATRIKIFRNSAIMFLVIAVANELVWRTQSEQIWVEFRTFVVFPALLFFNSAQIIFFLSKSQGDGDLQPPTFSVSQRLDKEIFLTTKSST